MDPNWQPVTEEEDWPTEAVGSSSNEPAPSAPIDPRPEAAIAVAAGRDRSRRLRTGATIAGALMIGGAAGALALGPALAASPAPAASAVASTDNDSGTSAGNHGPGGHVEAATDTSVAATAIGISEADLITALNNGQTMAAVATAHSVDPQKVIDALVADGKAELAAAVTAGTITQAQADAEQAEVVTRVTAQVNGTFGGPGGHSHGAGGHVEAATDTSVAATAIGISEADLITALNNGQTMAAVATAHSVDPQKVIDALVADGKAELAAAVTAGTITQAQADAEQAEVVTRVTAQVNGTFGGPGGHSGPDNDATP